MTTQTQRNINKKKPQLFPKILNTCTMHMECFLATPYQFELVAITKESEPKKNRQFSTTNSRLMAIISSDMHLKVEKVAATQKKQRSHM